AMPEFSKLATDGRHFLLPIDAKANVETSAGRRVARVTGEAIFRIHGDHPTSRGFSVARFAIAGTSVEAKQGPTGGFTVIGKTSGGTIEAAEKDMPIHVEITCEINYVSLDRARVKDMDKGCYYRPATEPAVARITGTLTEQRNGFLLSKGRIDVV